MSPAACEPSHVSPAASPVQSSDFPSLHRQSRANAAPHPLPQACADRQMLWPTDDTAHCGDRRRNETATPATFTEVPTGAPPPSHRGACLASLEVVVAVTDTYDSYERCSLTDLMDMNTYMSDNSYLLSYLGV